MKDILASKRSRGIFTRECPMLFGLSNQVFLPTDAKLDGQVSQAIEDVLDENNGILDWHLLHDAVSERTGAARDRITSLALALTCFTEGWQCSKRED